MKGKNQKIKLLRIWEILREDTDAEHTLSTVELVERLADEGIDAERKSIYDDIRLLQQCGYPVEIKRTRVNEYYVHDRSFSASELRLLMDSVQAARFVSATKAKELTLKIAALAGSARGNALARNTQVSEVGRRADGTTWDNIDVLQQAIERKRQIRFRYFYLDVRKQPVFRTRSDGTPYYVACPRSLVCNDDNYYLVCTMAGRDHYITFRVDRMSDVVLLRDKSDTPLWTKQETVAQYQKEAFGMYAGQKTRVTLLGVNEPNAINLVLDRFGYDITPVDRGDGTFHVGVSVRLSPVFYSWLFTVGDKIQLTAPADVKREYVEMLQKRQQQLEG